MSQDSLWKVELIGEVKRLFLLSPLSIKDLFLSALSPPYFQSGQVWNPKMIISQQPQEEKPWCWKGRCNRGTWVGHYWATSLSLFTFMHWRRKWQPTPVFLPGESQGRWSLLGCWSMGSHRVGHDLSDLAAAAARHSELRVFQKNWFCSYQEWSRSCGQEPWTQWGWKDLRWY